MWLVILARCGEAHHQSDEQKPCASNGAHESSNVFNVYGVVPREDLRGHHPAPLGANRKRPGEVRMLPTTPLLFTRNTVVISVHLHPWAVLEKKRRLGTRCHLRTVSATVALPRTARHIGSCQWLRCANSSSPRRRGVGRNARCVPISGLLDAPVALPRDHNDNY